MGDLFHESVPFEFIRRVFHIMFCSERHIFQVLTKRPEIMLAFCRQTGIDEDAASLRTALGAVENPAILPNVWLGVSVEDQESADKRIPLLLRTPAAVRWVSYEPALGPVDFSQTIPCGYYCAESVGHVDHGPNGNLGSIGWIVAGGESGPKARPSDLAWYRSVRDQCKEARVPFFMKQLGRNPVENPIWKGGPINNRKGDDPAEWPEDLRIREYPAS